MVTKNKLLICDGRLFKQMVMGGLAFIESHQETVNRLNVFPVPDGDTGTNMFLTMRKACDEIAGLDDPHVGNVSAVLAHGARLGARGNSGVILSEWLRGFAEALKEQESFDATLFAVACKNAVDLAYKGTLNPVEGTILTVTRQAMEAVTESVKTESDLQALFEVKVSAAYESLRHTPDLLPVLKEAGVVDSGGQGWTFIVEGMLRLLRGEDIQAHPAQTVNAEQPRWQTALIPEDEQGYGYDVQFLMHGSAMDVDAVRSAISEIGWSTLVVGDENLIKVHVHVHDPGVPISYAIKLGASIDDVVVENMQQQYQQYVAQRAAREVMQHKPIEGTAVVVVASGDGLRDLFDELGAACIILGGQTMNPSTEDFLSAIQSIPNDELILLPNNPNIIMAAQQAASLAGDKVVRVVPSRTIPQGIAAMVEYGNERESVDIDELVSIMGDALLHVVTIEVTTATRDVTINNISMKTGQLIGLIDDQIAVAGDAPYPVMKSLLEKVGADKRELITIYYGDEVDEGLARELLDDLQIDFSKQEFQFVYGGQPLYPYIVSVE